MGVNPNPCHNRELRIVQHREKTLGPANFAHLPSFTGSQLRRPSDTANARCVRSRNRLMVDVF